MIVGIKRRRAAAESNQWQRWTAERKFRIFLGTWKGDIPVGEILQEDAVNPEDLRVIEKALESTAIAGPRSV